MCRALAVNRDICLCCSIWNGLAQNASNIYHVLLENQSNFWSLLSPDYLEEFLEDECNHIFVKQRSDLWFHLCEQAVVNGSSCFDATGLNTLAAQKNHCRKFILKEQQEVTEETAANFKHGIETEVHAIATVVGLLLPALLPPCCTFIEVGPPFVNTQERQRMLEVSPDGIIKCCYGENNCPSNCAAVCSGITIEIKCPVLDSPYYNYRYYIHKRYVPQVMSEMFTQETSKGWFIVCSSDSVSVLNLSTMKKFGHRDQLFWLICMARRT